MATREMGGLETHYVESLLVVYLVDAKREFLCPQGVNGQLAAPQYPLRKLEEAI